MENPVQANRKREIRAVANFLLELQGSAEDAMALVDQGDFDAEFIQMLEEDIEEIARDSYGPGCWHGNYPISDEGICSNCGVDVVAEGM